MSGKTTPVKSGEAGRWSASFTLPWPPVVLSPNRMIGKNWAALWAAKKRYKAACAAAVLEQLHGQPGPPQGCRIAATAMFRPPSRRHSDLDNCVGSIKACLDGVASSLRVDDRWFRPWTVDFGEPVAGGAVELRLEVLAGPWLPEGALACLD